jgi:GT2 family glycosyltransferase
MMELSVLLVNFNDRPHLGECLSSIENTAGSLAYEIIVVDNDSADGSQAYITRHFPKVKLIANNVNLGFAKANNQGIRESCGEFILFLNTDAAVQPGALDRLIGELRSDPKAGAVGPALLRGSHSYQVSFGRRVNFFSELLQKLVLNPYFKYALKWSRKKRRVGWLSAACLLVRRTALLSVAGFDEDFFIYFEDLDLCLRIKKAGWTLVFLPQARVFHVGGATTSTHLVAGRFEYRKSQLAFYNKHGSKTSRFLLRLYLRLNIRLMAWRGNFRGEPGQWLWEQYARLLEVRRKGS